DLSRDRDPRQASETHKRIRGGEVFAQILGAAELPDTHGCESDVGPRSEAEEEAEYDEARHGRAGCDDHGIKRPNLIRIKPRQPAPENRPDIKNNKALVREILAKARGQGVAGDIRQRHKQRPLDQVRFSARSALSGQAAADEHAPDGEEEHGEEAEGAHGPCPADLGDQVLQHEGVDYAAQGAAGGADAGGEAAAGFEPVAYCGEGGGEDEGCGGAAEDAEDEHEVPVFCWC
ncbi:hypothetical protein V490_09099, partial [Pseudogymnoascus sp. VKM F-3557]